jgi:hypothetical protein
MKILFPSLLLLIILVFNSCYKLATERDRLYHGRWGEVNGSGFIYIEDDETGMYNSDQSGLVYGAVEIRGNKLRIDYIKLKINQKPRLDSVCIRCTWSSVTLKYYSIVLDGVTYNALK